MLLRVQHLEDRLKTIVQDTTMVSVRARILADLVMTIQYSALVTFGSNTARPSQENIRCVLWCASLALNNNFCPGPSGRACTNCPQEFRRLQHHIETLNASVASLDMSVSSLQATVATQRRDIIFLRYHNDQDPGVIRDSSEVQEYDTDTDDTELFSEYRAMKPLKRASTEPIDDSTVIPAQTSSLASVAMASQSLRSLCATATVNMTIASPSTSPKASADPFATPRPSTTNHSHQPQDTPYPFNLLQSDDFITAPESEYAYIRITESP